MRKICSLLYSKQPTRLLEDSSYDPSQPEIKIPRKVVKGGSHRCASNYCRRYRQQRVAHTVAGMSV